MEPSSNPPAMEGLRAPAAASPRGSALETGTRCLPWLLALVLATVVLLQGGTSATDIARYGAYWCLGVILPGTLVARATVGTRGNVPEDIAFGAVVGLALEVVGFAVWSLLGVQQWLWLWPALVAVSFAGVPGLRRHWRIGSPQPLPLRWSWGVASAIGICVLIMRQSAFAAGLPPAGGVYYSDTPWHLSIVQELTRSFPPQIPQVAGEVMRYHWFSHVHLAAGHLVSGAPVSTVVLRLGILPLLAVTALIGARLGRELSGVWWSGPIAAWSLVVFEGTNLLPVLGSARIIFPSSPTQVYVVPLVLGAATLIVRALRGSRLGPAGWAVLGLLLVVAAGGKPTALPLVLAGTCVAGLALLLQRRREWLAALSVVVIGAVILPVSMLAVAGGETGSRLSLFDFLEWSTLYHRLSGADFRPADGPVLPEGVSDLSWRSILILALLLAVPLVQNLGHLAPLATLRSRGLRRDPAWWFMAGLILAGGFVYAVLSHRGDSQEYFLGLGNAAAAVFGAWALAAAVPKAAGSGGRVAAVLVGGTITGAAVVGLARLVTPKLPVDLHNLGAVLVSFVVPLGVALGVVLAGLQTWRVLRRRAPGLRGLGFLLVLSVLVLGGPVPLAVERSVEGLTAVVDNSAFPHGDDFVLSPDAASVLAWVGQHTANDAVVATNRHCAIGPSLPRCKPFAFWVSGLGGRRTVIEGWGYTSGAEGPAVPARFQQRLAVNDVVFTEPTAATIGRLRREYGASWLVADGTAGPVSARLADFAVARFSSGQVTVYQLH